MGSDRDGDVSSDYYNYNYDVAEAGSEYPEYIAQDYSDHSDNGAEEGTGAVNTLTGCPGMHSMHTIHTYRAHWTEAARYQLLQELSSVSEENSY